jgi:DnaJ-class molecular chaperone
VDLYDVLGVSEDADGETIRSVYRQLARTFHPDANADPAAVEHFRKVTEAYVVLSDPKKRARYDRTRQSPRRRRPVGTETETTIGLRLAGIDLGGVLGVSVRMRTRPLFADDLDDPEEIPLRRLPPAR